MRSIKRTMKHLALTAILSTALTANAYEIYNPISYPMPVTVNGHATPTLNLDGKWQFRFSPKNKWMPVDVPGELAMQGIAVPHDQEVTYRKSFYLPADFAGKRTILRFNGTYSYATLTINGKRVREHRGGFSRWETDITPFVTPGKTVTIELSLSDPIEEISYGSGYAHHPICGILRSVEVFAIPDNFITDLRIDATLDSTFTDGAIRTDFNYTGTSNAKATLSLTSPDGKSTILLSDDIIPGENTLSASVNQPLKWDAEHPNLYTATITLTTPDGKEISTINKHIGFRKIDIDGDRLLVNGQPVKLRGACRHDLHPLRGRSTDRATDSIDAVLFKQANMNWVRTSHYPPTEDFIEFCDRLGI